MNFFKRLINKHTNQNLSESDRYYREAKSWYHERYELIEASLHRYRLISVGLGILLGLSVISISMIMPLKQYTYRMVTLNQTTGEVVTLKEVEPNDYSANWPVTKFFINQYISNRNLFNYDDYLRTYNTALAFSDRKNAEELHDEFIYTNPQSPLNTLKMDHYRDVTVLSINQLNSNTAIVRFRLTTHDKSASSDIKKEEMQAVVKWIYEKASDDLEYKDINPLGFYVTYYQVSPVTLSENSQE